MSLISGIRWYQAYPTPQTLTIIATQNALWQGGEPSSVYPYAPLTQIAAFAGQNANTPVCFAPVRDPAYNAGAGADILIITGFTGNNGFASGTITISGTVVAKQIFTVTQYGYGGAGTVQATYTALPTDNAATVAAALVQSLNNNISGSPTFGGAPATTSTTSAGVTTITLGSAVSGTPGNQFTYNATVSGPAGATVSPTAVTNFTGGGLASSAPLKFDGQGNITGLSYQITQPFTGCVNWHDHVWFWGDPANPDTLYAADINQPEGFTFMTKSGGYEIGQGDGDPSIRAVVPIGNALYIFKSNSIYMITGYDFQSGEYQFQVQPVVRGIGTPCSTSVCVLNNALIFWSGRKFLRLRAGSFQPEDIGKTLTVTQGHIIGGNQQLMRAVAGDFLTTSMLNESYSNSAAGVASEIFDSVALFACDIGSGVADTILVFDEEASRIEQKPAWSKWTGWQVGCWMPFGGGPNTGFQQEEVPYLAWCPPPSVGGPSVNAYATSATSDNGQSIAFFAQTGWLTLNKPALEKELHRIFLELESTSGVQFTFTITPSVTCSQSGQPAQLYAPFSGAFGATGGALNAESHQTLIAAISPFLLADAYIVGIGESSGTASYELVEITFDYIENAFTP